MDKSTLKRFLKKVDKDGLLIPGMSLPCWMWTSTLDNQGFPRFWYKGNAAYANRVRFILEGVPIGPEDHVVTLCQNRACVRPEHHVLGTALDARILGRGGYMGLGDQYSVRTMYANGDMLADHIVLSYGISRHVAEAVLLEGGLDIENPTCLLPALL